MGIAGDLDPFAGTATSSMPPLPKEKIHIRFYTQGRRAVTMLEGLDTDLDQKRIAKAMKRAFNCATSLHKDKESDCEVIKLQGDQCTNVRDWLLVQQILTQKEAAERLVIHKG